MTPDFENLENLKDFQFWRGRYNKNLLDAYDNYEAMVASAAEAHEKGLAPPGSELPDAMLGSLGVAERDPKELVKFLGVSQQAAMLTIAQILRSHWQDTHSGA